MRLEVRTPCLTRVDDRRIPLDFLASMEMFNRLLAQGWLPHIPRKTPITVQEIKKHWMPPAHTTLTYLAFESGMLLGSGTLLTSSNQNKYSKESGREAEYALIYERGWKDVGWEITRAILIGAKSKGLTFILHSSIDNLEEIQIMKELGYSPTRLIENYERYAKAGLDPRVYEFIIPPEKIKR